MGLSFRVRTRLQAERARKEVEEAEEAEAARCEAEATEAVAAAYRLIVVLAEIDAIPRREDVVYEIRSTLLAIGEQFQPCLLLVSQGQERGVVLGLAQLLALRRELQADAAALLDGRRQPVRSWETAHGGRRYGCEVHSGRMIAVATPLREPTLGVPGERRPFADGERLGAARRVDVRAQ